MHFTLNSVTALDSYLTIPIMYVYGFADCVDNSKHMQGYIKKCEGSPTASKSRTPPVKSCLKYEILCCYRNSDSILILVP